MNREFLREIEEKYGRMLGDWSRTNGLGSERQFVLPKVLPSEEFVIQGLYRPEEFPNKNRGPFPDKRGRFGNPSKGDERRRSPEKRGLPSKTPFGGTPRFERGICRFCDFADKTNGRCLIKMVNGGDCLFGGRR
jgi:hypothetical protein